ncbi:enamine deaminase RidA (YjgF/YER057c/UK114 family) [Sphingomonas sp. UYAg733]
MIDIKRVGPDTRYCRAVIHNRTAYLTGITADDWSGNVQEQTRLTLPKADEILAEIGADRSRLLSATIHLSDIADFSEMNAVWDEWVEGLSSGSRNGGEQARLSRTVDRNPIYHRGRLRKPL